MEPPADIFARNMLAHDCADCHTLFASYCLEKGERNQRGARGKSRLYFDLPCLWMPWPVNILRRFFV